MKKLLVTAVISVAALSFNASAVAEGQKSYKFVGDTEFASICEAAVTDNVVQFKKSMRHYIHRLNSSDVQFSRVSSPQQDNFQCGGMGVLEFAESRGAQKLVDYLLGEEEDIVATPKFTFVGDTRYAGLCKAAIRNDVKLFKRSLRSQIGFLAPSTSEVLEIVLNPNNVQCAGLGVLDFAESRGALRVVDYMEGVKHEPVGGNKFVFVGDTQYAGFCEAALYNDVSLFKRSVKTQVGQLAPSSKMVLEIVLDANNIQCSGMGITEFSEERNATKIVEFIQSSRI